MCSSDLAIALLADDDLGDVLVRVVLGLVVGRVAIDKNNNINSLGLWNILLNRKNTQMRWCAHDELLRFGRQFF